MPVATAPARPPAAVVTGLVRVLVVDRQALWRAGLRATFARHADLRIVGECGAASQAPVLVERLRPGVVLLDPAVAPPGRTAADLCRDLLARSPGTRILVLGPPDGSHRAPAAPAAPVGHLRRDATPDQAVRAVRAVAAGVRPPDRGPAGAPQHPPGTFTGRQLEVLRLLARGLSNRDIASALTVSEGTVKFHLAAIMSRLDAPCRTAAVYAASRQGLI